MNIRKILLASTALATFAMPAEAGPLAAVAAWVGATLAGGGVGAFLLSTGLSMGINAIASALYKPDDQPKYDVSFEVAMGDDLPLSFIVGDYVTAGKRKYIGSWGKNTRFITEVIEVSALPQGFEKVWINDEDGVPVAGKRAYIGGADPSNETTWTEAASVPSGKIDLGQPYTNMSDDGNRIAIKWLDGSQTVADPFLRAVFGDDEDYPWTASMIGRGKAVAIVTTRFDDDTLTNYPKFLFKPSPLPLYDWRKDSTNGGTGTQRWGNRATYQPTSNAAVIAYNVVRGIYYGSEWLWGGKNLEAWRLPVAEWTAAANECDAPVTLTNGVTEPLYRAGSEIKVDQRPADFLDILGKGANMKFAEVGGRLKPIVGLPSASVMTITDGDILITEGQSFSPFYAISDTYNAISAVYPEPGEKWTMKDAPEYVDADATAEDGGQYLPVPMSYPTAPYPRQVQRLMRSQMRDFRRMRRHSFHLPPGAYRLEPAIDVITWTSNRNGYDNKKFVVEKVRKLPGFNVLVDVREVNPADYDWTSTFERPVTVTSPKNPTPYVQNVPGFNAEPSSQRTAAGQPRKPTIRVWCDADQTNVNRLQVQARVKGRTENTHDTTFVFAAPFSWHLLDVLPVETYEVRGKLLASKKGRKSEWSGWVEVTTHPGSSITIDDMTEDFIESMRDIAQKAGVTPVDELPAQGEFKDQIVMKVPEGVLWRWDADAGEWVESMFGGIPDGYLDETKFAQGIEPNRIIPAGEPLPTVKSTNNIVWNGALYTWNGTEYTTPSFSLTPGIVLETHLANNAVTVNKIANSSVSAVKLATGAVTLDKILNGAVTELKLANGAVTDAKIAGMSASKLAGEITTTQISDSAVTAPKVVAGAIQTAQLAANAVTAIKVVAGAVTTDKLAADAVTAAKIAALAIAAESIQAEAVGAVAIAALAVTTDKLNANAVTAGKIATDAIESRHIRADAITAGKIQAGAVGADQIAAGAIVVSKLAVISFDNLVPDYEFTEYAAGRGVWGTVEGGGVLELHDVRSVPGYGAPYILRLYNNPAVPGTYSGAHSKTFKVLAGKFYNATVNIGSLTQVPVLARITWFDAAGAQVSYDDFYASPNGAGGSFVDRILQAPVQATSARFSFYIYNSGSSYVQIFGVSVRAANSGELIVDGAISALKIATEAVTANAIAAGAITATHIAAGAVTASKINVDSLSAISANMGTITTGTIRSGTSGERFQLDTVNGLRIWDSDGNLRIILGKIS